MPTTSTTTRAALLIAALVAAGTLFGAHDALAQAAGGDIFTRAEAIGQGIGRGGTAILGPMFLIIGGIIFLLSAWYLFSGANRNNQGRGFYGMAIVGFIAGGIMVGYGGFASLVTNGIVGTAPTASTAPLTFGAR